MIVFNLFCSDVKYKSIILKNNLVFDPSLNHEELIKSGNYVKLYLDKNDIPLKGVLFSNNIDFSQIFFDEKGNLSSINSLDKSDVHTISYSYKNEKLFKVSFVEKNKIACEMIFYYKNFTLNKIEQIKYDVNDSETSIKDKIVISFRIKKNLLIKKYQQYANNNIIEEHTYFKPRSDKYKLIYFDNDSIEKILPEVYRYKTSIGKKLYLNKKLSNRSLFELFNLVFERH